MAGRVCRRYVRSCSDAHQYYKNYATDLACVVLVRVSVCCRKRLKLFKPRWVAMLFYIACSIVVLHIN